MSKLCCSCNNPIEDIRLEFVPNAELCLTCQKESEKNTETFARYVPDGKTGCGIPIIAKNVDKRTADKNKTFWKRGTNRCTSG